MKKGVSILLALLLLPTILAIDISTSKESYQPQELFQAQITGNFLSLNENHVFIYKDGKVHPEPTLKGLTKQNNIYYFYSILPNEPGNFSFRIEGAQYLERGIVKSETISLPLNLIFEDESDLYINPGFIIPNGDFSIKVKSLFGNTDITAIFEPTGEEKLITLTEQVEETLNFKLPLLGPGQTKVTINDYEIPVFLIKNIEFPNNNLEFIPHIIEGTITPNNDYHFSVLIRNPTNRNLENIVFGSDLNTNFNPATIELLEPNQTAFVNLTITIEEVGEDISSQITATSGEDQFNLPVAFIITSNETEVRVEDATAPLDNTNTINPPSTLSCSQLGSICFSDQVCNGDAVDSLEGPCCIGVCEDASGSSITSYIGIILIAILIILVIYIFMKARSRKKEKSAEQILEDRQKKYKKRMKGKKVEGSLDSV